MHQMRGDARAAAKELREAAHDEKEFPISKAFLLKLEYEFTPQFFHDSFWVHVALKVLKKKYAEGDGHHLFLNMRGYFRRMRGYVFGTHHLSRKERRERRQEAIRFCEAIADTDPTP